MSHGFMHDDPVRAKRLLGLLEAVWERHPALRLRQLLSVAAGEPGWGTEDADLERELFRMLDKKGPPAEFHPFRCGCRACSDPPG